MTKIKKAFEPIVAHLRANMKATVGDVIETIEAMAAAKTGGAGGSTTLIKAPDGNVVAIFDYYFKKWMPLIGDGAVEFGRKAGSTSGYSTMSKIGTSLWTKQQREAKTAMSAILVDLEAGDLEIKDISDRKASIEADRKAIVETEFGFTSEDDCKAYLADYIDL